MVFRNIGKKAARAPHSRKFAARLNERNDPQKVRTHMSNETTNFKTGRSYEMRWSSNADLVTWIEIERRTARSVWIKDIFTGEVVRKSVKVCNDVETISPAGSYANAPVLFANAILHAASDILVVETN